MRADSKGLLYPTSESRRFGRRDSVLILNDLDEEMSRRVRNPACWTPRAELEHRHRRADPIPVVGMWYLGMESPPEGVSPVSVRKPEPIPLTEFVPWTTAHFHTQEIRDRFLHVAATLPAHDVEVEPMLDEVRGALVRWRPGQFLRLNDIAYAHGGRIVVTAGRGRLGHPSQ